MLWHGKAFYIADPSQCVALMFSLLLSKQTVQQSGWRWLQMPWRPMWRHNVELPSICSNTCWVGSLCIRWRYERNSLCNTLAPQQPPSHKSLCFALQRFSILEFSQEIDPWEDINPFITIHMLSKIEVIRMRWTTFKTKNDWQRLQTLVIEINGTLL